MIRAEGINRARGLPADLKSFAVEKIDVARNNNRRGLTALGGEVQVIHTSGRHPGTPGNISLLFEKSILRDVNFFGLGVWTRREVPACDESCEKFSARG